MLNFEPPTPTYSTEKVYEECFTHNFRYTVNLYKEYVPDEEWDSWVISFETFDKSFVKRMDAGKEEIEKIINNPVTIDAAYYNIHREFHCKIVPDVCVVWPYNESGWGPRIEIKIPKVG